MKRFIYVMFFLVIGVASFILNTSNTFALTMDTDSINYYLRYSGQNSYNWTQRYPSGLVGHDYNVAAIRQFGVLYRSIYATGNFASLHMETNLVAYPGDPDISASQAFYWLNRNNIVVKSCSFNGNPLILDSNNVSSVDTTWWMPVGSDNYVNASTLTLYVDVTLSGFSTNVSGDLVCDIGTDINTDFFWSLENTGSDILWEKNPSTIVFGTNLDDTLLQTQINQNNTIINNQENLNNWLTDNTEPDVDTSALSGASGWLPPGPVDSVLTLPITLAQNVVNIFTGQNQCRPIVLPFDFLGAGTSLSIPCLSTYLADAGANIIWNTVGLVISAFMYYYTLRWLYKFIDDTLTLRENDTTLWGGL